MKTLKEFLEKPLTGLKNVAGEPLVIKKVPVRMASGKVEKHYPGKSGSSGGGGGE